MNIEREPSKFRMFLENSKFVGELILGKHPDHLLVTAARSATLAGPLSFTVGVVGMTKVSSGEVETGIVLLALGAVLCFASGGFSLYLINKINRRDHGSP